MTMLQHGLVPSTGGYQIERSLRFNSADSATLTRTPGSSGNRKTWTTSFWVKRSALGYKNLLNCSTAIGSSDNQLLQFAFDTNDRLYIFQYNNSTVQAELITTSVYRDLSAWYHIVVSYDTTQATASNRIKFYVNGSQVTAFSTATYPTQNLDGYINHTVPHVFGRYAATSSPLYFDGYLADFYIIDGSALDPSSFGENDTDTGVWKPKAYTGSYGTNGFKLTFSDNSGTTSTTLGKDTSGNGNNWTPNNFSVTAGAGNDSLVDTPTPYGTDTGAGGEVRGNYATLNPIDYSPYVALSNGNLDYTISSNQKGFRKSTIAVSSGKWYAECTVTSAGNILGIATSDTDPMGGSGYVGATSTSWGYNSSNGQLYNNGSGTAYGASFTTNDVIGIALNLDAGTLTFYKNGVSQGTAASSLSGTFVFATGQSGSGVTGTFNFGQRPFAYTAPSGFKALCTTNLPTPTIGATSSTRADDYFNTVLWTGNSTGTTRSISGVGFQPDLVWAKIRNDPYRHTIYDAVRGAAANKYLSSATTGAEGDSSLAGTYGYISAFESDGFQVTKGSDAGQPYAWVNVSSGNYVAWNWKANGAGSSNTAGSITSTVSANTTAGFSIVTYTGNATANQTVGHGLGKAVDLLIIKSRSSNPSPGWIVWHRSVCSGNGKALALEETNAIQGPFGTPMWDSSNTTTQSSSTTFTIGANSTINTSGNNYVAYCFAPVAGYSAFGSYTGNGSADGPFVYTGFRPAYVLIKCSNVGNSTRPWVIKDKLRAAEYNPQTGNLYANLSNAEDTDSSVYVDLLSNGFKIRGTYGGVNASSDSYIYAAFAEVPAKFSLAR